MPWLLRPGVATYASVDWDITGSDNGLLPFKHQAIIWTKAVLLVIGHLRTNVNLDQNTIILIQIWIKIQ